MSVLNLTAEQQAIALQRAKNVDSILLDYEKQYNFELPRPWKEAIEKLLLGGLTDPELHLVFNTLQRVEHDAGRLAEPAMNYEKFNE